MSPNTCSSIRRFANNWCGLVRAGKEMQNLTPALRTAAEIRSHSSTVRAMAFSVKMCLPASAAATMTSACMLVGASTTTPSMSSAAAAYPNPLQNPLPTGRPIPFRVQAVRPRRPRVSRYREIATFLHNPLHAHATYLASQRSTCVFPP